MLRSTNMSCSHECENKVFGYLYMEPFFLSTFIIKEEFIGTLCNKGNGHIKLKRLL